MIRGGDGLVKEGYRRRPGWLSPIIAPADRRPRVAALAAGLAAALGPLALLALLFVLRCVLDPWNTAYYALPAVIALVAWEATSFDRPPVLALALTMATWATWEWVVPAATPDVEALVYLGWSLPFTGLLAWRLYAPALTAVPTLSSGGRARDWSTTQ